MAPLETVVVDDTVRDVAGVVRVLLPLPRGGAGRDGGGGDAAEPSGSAARARGGDAAEPTGSDVAAPSGTAAGCDGTDAAASGATAVGSSSRIGATIDDVDDRPNDPKSCV